MDFSRWMTRHRETMRGHADHQPRTAVTEARRPDWQGKPVYINHMID
jgi:hypothetical protein